MLIPTTDFWFKEKTNTPRPHLKLLVKGKIQSEEGSCYTAFPVTIAKLHWGEINEEDWSSRHSAVNGQVYKWDISRCSQSSSSRSGPERGLMYLDILRLLITNSEPILLAKSFSVQMQYRKRKISWLI